MSKGNGLFFGLGLSRSATTYLHEVFLHNGMSSRHYPRELVLAGFQNDKMGWRKKYESVKQWKLKGFAKEHIAIESKGADLFLEECVLNIDLPITFYARELFQKYPDAKFILTVREKTSWLESMKWMLTEGRIIWKYDVLDDFILESVYGTRNFDENKLSKFYDDYHASISSLFSNDAERLLSLTLPIDESDLSELSSFIGFRSKLSNVPRQNARRRSTTSEKIDYRMRSVHGYSRLKSFFK